MRTYDIALDVRFRVLRFNKSQRLDSADTSFLITDYIFYLIFVINDLLGKWDIDMIIRKSGFLKILLLSIFFVFFLLYIYFDIQHNEAPIDYKTFMDIGQRFLAGEEIYTVNSYYPMPYVMVFAFFALLPRSLSLILWLSLPVLAALCISGFSPLILLYAPLIGHFLGGQSAIFGLIGFWGYRKYNSLDRFSGGVWLALITIKPQLAIAPCLWAFIQWVKNYREKKRIPRQSIGFGVATCILYLPSFIVAPNWVGQWLSNPRPLFLRAMSGLFPRTLLYLFPQNSPWYWILLIVLSSALFVVIFYACRKEISLDIFMLYSFVVNPMVHDYDLIQLVPILKTTRLKIIAALLSIPGWIVLFTQYTNDTAWIVFTIIAPGLLYALVRKKRHAEDTRLGMTVP